MQLTSKSAFELNKAPSTRFVTGNCDLPAHSCDIETVLDFFERQVNDFCFGFKISGDNQTDTYIGWNICCAAD